MENKISHKDLRLLVSFIKMQLRDRFLGSAFGVIWAIVQPALMLSIFTFVFGFVFKAKLPGAETNLSYVIWLISGYGPWLAISEGLMSSTISVSANAQIVKNIPFKVELLPISGALMGGIPLLVSLIYLMVLLVFDGATLSLSWLVVPLYIVAQFIIIIALGLFLSGINVIARDISHLLPNLLLVVLFASPIFYQITVYPASIQAIMEFNPIYLLAEGYRQPLLYGNTPPIWQLLYCYFLGIVLLVAGVVFFRRIKRYFESRL